MNLSSAAACSLLGSIFNGDCGNQCDHQRVNSLPQRGVNVGEEMEYNRLDYAKQCQPKLAFAVNASRGEICVIFALISMAQIGRSGRNG